MYVAPASQWQPQVRGIRVEASIRVEARISSIVRVTIARASVRIHSHIINSQGQCQDPFAHNQ